MIKLSSIAGATVAVFGLGSSGATTARALIAGGANVLAWDDNPRSRAEATLNGINCTDLKDQDWKAINILVLAPGVPLTHPEPHRIVKLAKEHGVEIIGDIELFCRERQTWPFECPLIAVTGTNGKSTTTALIHHILNTAGLSAQMGGNIGRPVLDLDPPEQGQPVVLECSSYQIDLTPGLNPDIGILINLSPDHIERHGSFENYCEVKSRLVLQSQTAIVSVDDPQSQDIFSTIENSGQSIIAISTRQALSSGIFFRQGALWRVDCGKEIEITDLLDIASLPGQHNGENAAAAVAALLHMGLDRQDIVHGLKSFPGLAHRLQQIADCNGIVFVNDSKATNADAAAWALAAYDNILWIAGGRAKDCGIVTLEPHFSKINQAFLFGEAAHSFAETLTGKVAHKIFDGLTEAVSAAWRHAHEQNMDHAVILFSPAAASFDQFDNFEKRGAAFVSAAQAIIAANQRLEGPADD